MPLEVGIAFCRPKNPLNIRNCPEDVKAALELMGDYDDDDDTYSFKEAVKQIKLVRSHTMNEYIISIIYGSRGINRYYVQFNGEIVFSRAYCRIPYFSTCKNAQDLGFIVR